MQVYHLDPLKASGMFQGYGRHPVSLNTKRDMFLPAASPSHGNLGFALKMVRKINPSSPKWWV